MRHFLQPMLALVIVVAAAVFFFVAGCSGEGGATTTTVIPEQEITTVTPGSTTTGSESADVTVTTVTTAATLPEATMVVPTTAKPAATMGKPPKTMTTVVPSTTKIPTVEERLGEPGQVTAEDLAEFRSVTGIPVSKCLGSYQGIYDNRLGSGYGEFVVSLYRVQFRVVITNDRNQLESEPSRVFSLEGDEIFVRVEGNGHDLDKFETMIADSIS